MNFWFSILVLWRKKEHELNICLYPMFLHMILNCALGAQVLYTCSVYSKLKNTKCQENHKYYRISTEKVANYKTFIKLAFQLPEPISNAMCQVFPGLKICKKGQVPQVAQFSPATACHS